jgi:hypothetical protein
VIISSFLGKKEKRKCGAIFACGRWWSTGNFVYLASNALHDALMSMKAAQTQVVSRLHACMVSIAISVCTGMFFPYSKNAGAEFVSKIGLASSSTPMSHGHVHSV